MITQALAQAVLAAALETGGDFSELYLEDTESNNLSMMGGTVENAAYSRLHGAGVRVLKGTRYAYAYSADTSEAALLATARAAAAAIAGDERYTPKTFAVNDCRKAPVIAASDVNNAQRVNWLREASKAAKDHSPEITQTIAALADVDQRVLICNSEGVFAYDRRPRVRIVVQAVASDGTQAQTGRRSPGRGCGYELFDTVDPSQLGQQAARSAVTMLHAVDCPAGVFPVVIDGGFGGVIFHEACGHSLEATSVSRGNSVFCGKLGQQIAAPCVTAIDDGIMPGEWGTIGVDDEGTPSRRRVLIENGILKSYMVDILGGRRMGMEPTGSSRRQNYTFAPTSRMTNTFIAPGKDDAEEMIRTMGDGLFAASMGGGSVNPLTGEFNFAVDEGYWVKDGKIFCPVRGATLIGKGHEVLHNIDRVGPEMWMAPGMCGSASGSVPTNVGQPRIRVSSIIVGGKGGAL
ncbi:MAG: TldD/PmbA family protein [Clostridia bacterium]|nr:TldD/PmbA family protein [Clostridia bacterium]MBP3588563.1 TldD/PmbA family protein [Clostridia bacterium]